MARRLAKLAFAATAAALLASCTAAPGIDHTASEGSSGVLPRIGIIVAGSERDLQVNVGDTIYFATDASVVGLEGLKLLQRQADWLKRYPDVAVTIEGHCDERGTREYNLALGNRRAVRVRDLLVAQGVAPRRLTVISYGKEHPAVIGSDEAAWAQNRRAVTVVTTATMQTSALDH